jgi:hypothetical protein
VVSDWTFDRFPQALLNASRETPQVDVWSPFASTWNLCISRSKVSCRSFELLTETVPTRAIDETVRLGGLDFDVEVLPLCTRFQQYAGVPNTLGIGRQGVTQDLVVISTRRRAAYRSIYGTISKASASSSYDRTRAANS